jgi:hypothetical protein
VSQFICCCGEGSNRETYCILNQPMITGGNHFKCDRLLMWEWRRSCLLRWKSLNWFVSWSDANDERTILHYTQTHVPSKTKHRRKQPFTQYTINNSDGSAFASNGMFSQAPSQDMQLDPHTNSTNDNRPWGTQQSTRDETRCSLRYNYKSFNRQDKIIRQREVEAWQSECEVHWRIKRKQLGMRIRQHTIHTIEAS